MDGPSCQDTCAGARGMAASAVFRVGGGGGGSVSSGGVSKGILSRCLSVSLQAEPRRHFWLHGGSVDDRGYERRRELRFDGVETPLPPRWAG